MLERGVSKKLGSPASTRLGTLRTITGLLLYLIGSIGCRTASPPLSITPEDGAVVHEGQAVWTSNSGAPSMAGELLVISSPEGSFFVQFSKPPFNLVTASTSKSGWHLETQRGRQQSGSGPPPPDVLWFQLARTIYGSSPERDWQFSFESERHWVLKNPITGEKLKGYFSQ